MMIALQKQMALS